MSLKRGLLVLDVLARQKKTLSFSQIKAEMGGMNHASLSRLLRTLVEGGYVYKDPEGGCYSCGYKMAVFSSLVAKGRRDYLIQQYEPLMQGIADQFDVTCILLERVQDTLINIHKTQTRVSVHMQELGYVNDQLNQPWMQLLASRDPKVEGLYESALDREVIAGIRERGYCYDNASIRPDFRRLGFPICLDGEMIGALGLGGTILQIRDDNLETLVDHVKKKMKMAEPQRYPNSERKTA